MSFFFKSPVNTSKTHLKTLQLIPQIDENISFDHCGSPDGLHSFEPRLSIKPNYCTFFAQHEYLGYQSNQQSDYDSDGNLIADTGKRVLLPDNTETNGILSEKAGARLRNAVNWMCALAVWKEIYYPLQNKETGLFEDAIIKYKVAFVTLTLSAIQMHPDREIMKCIFRPFLTKLTEKYGTKVAAENKKGYTYELNYIWKAERQENGNIHFHLIVDKFIWHEDLRLIWNECQEKLGYVSAYRETRLLYHANGFNPLDKLLVARYDGKHNTVKTWDIEKQKKAYEKGVATNWSNPNSTDIHSVQKIRDISKYIAKYMGKSPLEPAEEKLYKKYVADKKDIMNGDNVEALPPEFSDKWKYFEFLQSEIERMSESFVGCRLWDCSQNLERMKLVVDVDTESVDGELKEIFSSKLYKERRDKMIMQRRLNDPSFEPSRFYFIIPFAIHELKKMKAHKIIKLYDDYLGAERARVNEQEKKYYYSILKNASKDAVDTDTDMDNVRTLTLNASQIAA